MKDFEHHLGAGDAPPSLLKGARGPQETLMGGAHQRKHTEACSPRPCADPCTPESVEQQSHPRCDTGVWGALTGMETGTTPPAFPSGALRDSGKWGMPADSSRVTWSTRVLPEPTSQPGALHISACTSIHLPATSSPCTLEKQPHRCHVN